MERLAGKVAIVTGAGRGIGAEIARTFAREGAAVVIASLIREEIDRVAEEVRGTGRAALPVQTDVTVKAEIESMVQRTQKEFGKIDPQPNRDLYAGSRYNIGVKYGMLLAQLALALAQIIPAFR